MILGVKSGPPLDLFTSGKALWLGVEPQIAGAAEQPRILLVAVPYALKAADADTLGGKPASDLSAWRTSRGERWPVRRWRGHPRAHRGQPEFLLIGLLRAGAFSGRVAADGNAVAGQVAINSGPRALTEDATSVDVKGKVGTGTTTPASVSTC